MPNRYHLCLATSVSIYTVSLIFVDRVIYLKKRLTYECIVTPWRMFFAIVAIRILSIAVSILPLFGFGEVGYNPNLATCSFIVDHYGPAHSAWCLSSPGKAVCFWVHYLHHQEALAKETPEISWFSERS